MRFITDGCYNVYIHRKFSYNPFGKYEFFVKPIKMHTDGQILVNFVQNNEYPFQV